MVRTKEKRRRNILLTFWASPEEYNAILQKMYEAKELNMSDYLRRMAAQGKVVVQDFLVLKAFTSALGQVNQEFIRLGNNLNQIAKKVNETDEVSLEDLEAVKVVFHTLQDQTVRQQNEVMKTLNQLLEKGGK